MFRRSGSLARATVSLGVARAIALFAPALLASALLALPLLVSACAGNTQGAELPERCLDGKDNDGDGTIDCDDADCQRLPICGAPLVPVDQGPPPPPADGQPPPPDGPQIVDQGLPPDTAPPPPPSSYGTTCRNFGSLCPDGNTVCIRRSQASDGYCSRPCIQGNKCEDGPTGTPAYCVYGYNGTYYCAFTCKWQSTPYSCPGGWQCYIWASYQSMCFPP